MPTFSDFLARIDASTFGGCGYILTGVAGLMTLYLALCVLCGFVVAWETAQVEEAKRKDALDRLELEQQKRDALRKEMQDQEEERQLRLERLRAGEDVPPVAALLSDLDIDGGKPCS